MSQPTVGVIGAGRVGAVLAARLRAAGYPIVGVFARSSASQLRVSTLLPGVAISSPEDIARSSDILILSVPDDSLVAVALSLADVVRPGQVVLHTSGRHGLAAIQSLAAAGARTIAFHPAMTFTGTQVDLDRTCVFGLTAADADHQIAESLVADLGGVPMWIDEADRVTYHAALAHGANHLTTIVGQAIDLLRGIGAADPAAVLRPLLTASLDNALVYGDAALTGPVARGDVRTVRAHVEAIDDPSTLDTYRVLAAATADRAGRSGRLDRATVAQVRDVVDPESVR